LRKCSFQIRLASVEAGDDPDITKKDIDYMGSKFRVTRGDYCKLLECVVQHLEKAKVSKLASMHEDRIFGGIIPCHPASSHIILHHPMSSCIILVV
jgi:hypothetical protein